MKYPCHYLGAGATKKDLSTLLDEVSDSSWARHGSMSIAT